MFWTLILGFGFDATIHFEDLQKTNTTMVEAPWLVEK
jgi:hypothetical protein